MCFDQEFEDMEDELENDFEEERSLNDDFDEHADDMEDLEDLTPEEVEDREAILDDREGRLAGPIVRCGRWTNRVVELDGNTTAKFESTKITNRCTVLYKPTNCTGPIKLTCSKFLVDMRDPQKTSLPSVPMETSRCGTSAAPASLALAGSPRRVSDVLSHVNSHSNSSSSVLLVVPSANSISCSIYNCCEQTQTR